MATTTAPVAPAASKALNCQTWVLKVSIHCQGCKRKVEKVLRGIDGVYATTIDSQQQRVTVTGNIEVEALIKKLNKNGRHAEIWQEKLSRGKKEATRTSNSHDQDDSKSDKKHGNNGSKLSVKFSGDGSSEVIKNTDKPTVSGNEDGGAKSGGKNKNKKEQKEYNGNSNHPSGSATSGQAATAGYGGSMDQAVSSNNLNPTRQHSIQIPQGFFYVPSGYAANISMAYPNGSSATNFYFAPPPSSIYENATAHRAITPSGLDTLYVFSDENVNGCMIM